MSFWSYRPYVPVAKRRAQAAKEVDRLKKKGRAILPVVLEGRKIAQSFWGKAWCDNLERYSDFGKSPAARSNLCSQRLGRRFANRARRCAGLGQWLRYL